MKFYKETDFKKSLFSKIPKEWKIVTLKDVLLLLRNGLTVEQNEEGKGYPITRIETISEERIDTSRLGYVKPSDLKDRDIKEYRIIIGDILFSHINSLEHIGKTAIYEGIPDFLLHGMNLLLLRPNKNKIHPKFLLYLLRLFREKGIFWALSKKAVNQASINQTELGKLIIFLPSLDEQKAIAHVLSTVDKAIQRIDEAISHIERLKKGLMQTLLTGGIGHKEFKETEIGRIPKEWEVVKLRDIAEKSSNSFVDGPFGSNLKVRDFTNSGIPVIQLHNIGEGFFDDRDIKYISREKFNKLIRHETRPYDIVIAKIGDTQGDGRNPIARACIVPKKFDQYMIVADCVRLRPDINIVNPHFLQFAINSKMVRKQAVALAKGTTRKRINLSEIKTLKIPLPPLPEQQKIAEILSTVDMVLRLKREKKEKLVNMKKGIMDLLLTGKIRVSL